MIFFCNFITFSGEDSIDVTVDRFDPGREVLANNGMVFTSEATNKACLISMQKKDSLQCI